jgi:hypothetical protein
MFLLQDQTTNIDGTSIEFNPIDYNEKIFICSGTFDGCVVKVEVKGDGDWVGCGDESVFTEKGSCLIVLRGGLFVRGVVSSAGAGTSVSLEMV